MDDWLVALLMAGMYVLGFTDAWAICNEHRPFWRGYGEVRFLSRLFRS